jgi:hypothetical protein
MESNQQNDKNSQQNNINGPKKTCMVHTMKYNLDGHYTVERGHEFYEFTLVRAASPGWHPAGTVTYIPLTEKMGFGDWDNVTVDKITVRPPIPSAPVVCPTYAFALSIKDCDTKVLKAGYYKVLQTDTCYLFILKKPLTSDPKETELVGKATEIPLTKVMGKFTYNMDWWDEFGDVTPDKITKV